MNMNIKNKILFPFCLLAVIPLFSCLDKDSQEAQENLEFNRKLATTLSTIMGDSIKIFNTTLSQTEKMNINPALAPDYTGHKLFKWIPNEKDVKNPAVALHKMYDDIIKAHPGINMITVGYENDHLLMSGTLVALKNFYPTKRPWYIKAKANKNKLIISDPYTTRHTNVSLTKQSADGKFVLTIDVDISKFAGSVKYYDPYTDKIFLIDKSDHHVAFSNVRDMIGKYSKLYKKKPNMRHNSSYQGYFLNKTPIAHTNWELYTMIGREDIYNTSY